MAQLYCQLFASCLAVFIVAEVTSINLKSTVEVRLSDHAIKL